MGLNFQVFCSIHNIYSLLVSVSPISNSSAWGPVIIYRLVMGRDFLGRRVGGHLIFKKTEGEVTHD